MPPLWELVKRAVGMIGVAALLWLGIAVDLAPLHASIESWPYPDLLFLTVACLVLRRPSLLPLPLIAAAGLLRDLLTGAPVGAGMLSLLIAAWLLRGLAPTLRLRSLAVEWVYVMAMAAIAVFLPAPMLWLVLSESSTLSTLAGKWFATVAAYPLVVALMRVGHDERIKAGNLRDRAST